MPDKMIKQTLPNAEAPPAADEAYRRTIAEAKAASTLELLFRTARVVEEEARERALAKPGRPPIRRVHTSLFPFIALEGTRITELAAHLGVTKQAVGEWVDELEEMGVVERKPDPEDGRAKRVHFTARGRAGLLDGLASLRAYEEELAGSVGEARMKDLRRALAALLAEVEARRAR